MKQVAWGLIGTAMAVWLAVFFAATQQAPAACTAYERYSPVLGVLAIAAAYQCVSFRGELRFAAVLAVVSISFSVLDALTHGWL